MLKIEYIEKELNELSRINSFERVFVYIAIILIYILKELMVRNKENQTIKKFTSYR